MRSCTQRFQGNKHPLHARQKAATVLVEPKSLLHFLPGGAVAPRREIAPFIEVGNHRQHNDIVVSMISQVLFSPLPPGDILTVLLSITYCGCIVLYTAPRGLRCGPIPGGREALSELQPMPKLPSERLCSRYSTIAPLNTRLPANQKRTVLRYKYNAVPTPPVSLDALFKVVQTILSHSHWLRSLVLRPNRLGFGTVSACSSAAALENALARTGCNCHAIPGLTSTERRKPAGTLASQFLLIARLDDLSRSRKSSAKLTSNAPVIACRVLSPTSREPLSKSDICTS